MPKFFQVWAAKHVLGMAGMMKFLTYQDGRKTICPSCRSCEETCAHIARCPEPGRSEAFSQAVAELTRWMRENETHPDLVSVISEYARGRGEKSCVECAGDLPSMIQEFAISQDRIGWGNFIVGMISTKLTGIQDAFLRVRGSARLSERWATGLIAKLLQITHGQWIYRCVLVHDRSIGTLVNQHKAQLLEEITKQLSMGAESLMEDDKFLLECNLSECYDQRRAARILAVGYPGRPRGKSTADAGKATARYPDSVKETGVYLISGIFCSSDHVSSEFPRQVLTWKES